MPFQILVSTKQVTWRDIERVSVLMYGTAIKLLAVGRINRSDLEIFKGRHLPSVDELLFKMHRVLSVVYFGAICFH